MTQPPMSDRIVSGLSYLSMGFIGFLWLLVCLFTRNPLKPFVQYHIFQSIFISIAYFLLSMICGFLMTVLSYIPLINKLVAAITFLLNSPFIGNYSFIQVILYTIIIFLTVTSFMGLYGRLPWISDIIDQNVGRR